MTKKTRIFSVILAFFLFLSACGGDFDAAGYVRAVLDERFQGEFADAARIMGVSEYEIKQDYESNVENFVLSYLTEGYEEVSDYTVYEYVALVKEIFSVMKYDVKKSEKTGDKEYDVSVEIQPVDIFPTYVEKLKELSEDIEKSAQNGGYEGTEEEIQSQMQNDYLYQAYSLLEECYLNMKYLGKETVILRVTGDSSNVYSVDEKDFTKLTERLLGIDELNQ